ncbi:hypothetical protein ABG768_004917, partial [Culter alburnus]
MVQAEVWKKIQTTDMADCNLKCVGPLRGILKPYCLRLDNTEYRRQEAMDFRGKLGNCCKGHRKIVCERFKEAQK